MLKTKSTKDEGRLKPISEPEITVNELYTRIINEESPNLLIDLRSSQEYDGSDGHIKGALSFPLNELMNRLNLLEDYTDDEIVTLCYGGGLSMVAAKLLTQAGFNNVRSLRGGMMLWHKRGFPTVT